LVALADAFLAILKVLLTGTVKRVVFSSLSSKVNDFSNDDSIADLVSSKVPLAVLPVPIYFGRVNLKFLA